MSYRNSSRRKNPEKTTCRETPELMARRSEEMVRPNVCRHLGLAVVGNYGSQVDRPPSFADGSLRRKLSTRSSKSIKRLS